MKKIIILLAVVGLAAGGWFFLQNQSTTTINVEGAIKVETPPLIIENPYITQIPKDTVATALSLQSIPVKDLLNLHSLKQLIHSYRYLIDIYNTQTQQDNKNDSMLATPVGDINASTLEKWGIGQTIDYALYTNGVLPVFKLSVANSREFLSQLNQFLTEKNIAYTASEDKTQLFIDTSDAYQIIASGEDNTITITLNGKQLSPTEAGLPQWSTEALTAVLNNTPLDATQHLDTQVVNQRVTATQIPTQSAIWIDFDQMNQLLTTNHRLSSQINVLLKQEGNIAQWQSEACQALITQWIQDWPYAISGTRIENTSINSKIVIHSPSISEQSLLYRLQSNIPLQSKNSLYEVSLGINGRVLNDWLSIVPSSENASTTTDTPAVSPCKLNNGLNTYIEQARQAYQNMNEEGKQFANALEAITLGILNITVPTKQTQSTETQKDTTTDDSLIVSAYASLNIDNANIWLQKLYNQIAIPAGLAPVTFDHNYQEILPEIQAMIVKSFIGNIPKIAVNSAYANIVLGEDSIQHLEQSQSNKTKRTMGFITISAKTRELIGLILTLNETYGFMNAISPNLSNGISILDFWKGIEQISPTNEYGVLRVIPQQGIALEISAQYQ